MPSALLAGWKRACLPVALSLSAALLVLSQVSPVVNPVTPDESNLVYDASRLSRGEVLYRDFFSFLPPGTLTLLHGAESVCRDHPETAARYAILLALAIAWAASFWALKHSGATSGRSLWVAATLPVVFFPFAPFNPHHGFGAAALSILIAFSVPVWEGGENKMRWLALGGLAALCAWFVQSAGLLAVAIVLFSALVGARGLADGLRKGSTALAGGLLAGLVLWIPTLAHGAAGGAWHDTVLWPLARYHQPGNINDVKVFGDLAERLRTLWEGIGSQDAWGFLVAVAGTGLYAGLLAGALACGAGVMTALLRMGRQRKLPDALHTVFSIVAMLSVAVFLQNPTWVHFIAAFYPVALLGSLVVARAREAGGPRERVWTFLLSALIVAGFIYHGRNVLRTPEAWEFTDVDRVDRENPLNASLRASRLRPGDTLAVLPTGGNVYLYTFPSAIGYTYLFPLEDGYNNLEDHERAARQIEERKPKIILIHRIRLKVFIGDGGPISRVIQRDYAEERGSPAVALFARQGGGG